MRMYIDIYLTVLTNADGVLSSRAECAARSRGAHRLKGVMLLYVISIAENLCALCCVCVADFARVSYVLTKASLYSRWLYKICIYTS